MWDSRAGKGKVEACSEFDVCTVSIYKVRYNIANIIVENISLPDPIYKSTGGGGMN